MEFDPLKELKSAARKIGKAKGLKHIGALEFVAGSLGFPHWNALTVANKKGWLPSPANHSMVEALVAAAVPSAEFDWCDEPDSGEIQGHHYHVIESLDDTYVHGRGWELKLPEAPLAPPKFRVTDKRIKANPIAEQSFRDEVLAVATRWRKGIHARIADDWPARSTVPDTAGFAEHPLGHAVSDVWWCMHCDGSFNSKQITANLFHCPNCLASPLDIHTSPWWLEQEQPPTVSA
ncbi:MAG: hypothetical protein RLP98_11390 [Devosia sp.]